MATPRSFTSSVPGKARFIVIGHVLGVVAAHERAVTLFPARLAVAGQVPLTVLMVAFTVGGLTQHLTPHAGVPAGSVHDVPRAAVSRVPVPYLSSMRASL